jgi:hypothetical protein
MVTNQETVKDPSIERIKTFRESFVAPNWEHPVFFGISKAIPQLLSLVDWPDLEFFNQLARERCLELPDGRPLTFVHQSKKPSRWRRRKESKSRYEESVLEQAVIPSRLASWHDFFNNISWLIFPRAKLALVERLAAANSNRTAYDVERAQFRSREGDRLAMLDEGGLIKLGQTPTRFLVFGHALQESFVAGKLDVWSLTLPLPFCILENSIDLLSKADCDLASLIQSGFFAVDAPGFESTCLKDIAEV